MLFFAFFRMQDVVIEEQRKTSGQGIYLYECGVLFRGD